MFYCSVLMAAGNSKRRIKRSGRRIPLSRGARDLTLDLLQRLAFGFRYAQ